MIPQAILARINPKGLFAPAEYLHRIEELFKEDRWEWQPTQEGAHRFPSHDEASKAQAAHAYEDDAGKVHLPWPLVVAPRDAQEPSLVIGAVEIKPPVKTIAERAAIGRKSAHSLHVRRRERLTAEESFEFLERRHLA